MKNWLALIAVVIVLGVIARFVFGCGAPPPDSEPPPETGDKGKTEKSWSGQAVKDLNLEFSQRKATWMVSRMTFTGLNSAKSNVAVRILSEGRSAPSWLTAGALEADETNTPRSYRPQVTSRAIGRQRETVARYKGIPTNLLGPLCSGPGSWPDKGLMLDFGKVPGPPVSVLISAPPAPAGRCLGSGRDVVPEVKIARTKRLGGNNVAILGRLVDSNAKRVLVDVRGPAKKVKLKPRVANQRFEVKFKLPKGSYQVSVGLTSGKWTDQARLRVR
jgi:hypothetical protein